jgi:hypothetical protein
VIDDLEQMKAEVLEPSLVMDLVQLRFTDDTVQEIQRDLREYQGINHTLRLASHHWATEVFVGVFIWSKGRQPSYAIDITQNLLASVQNIYIQRAMGEYAGDLRATVEVIQAMTERLKAISPNPLADIVDRSGRELRVIHSTWATLYSMGYQPTRPGCMHKKNLGAG